METTELILASGTGLIAAFIMIIMIMLLNLGRRLDDLNDKIDANGTKIEVNATKIDANADIAAENRDQLKMFRTENRDNFNEVNRNLEKLNDKVDANAVRHDRKIDKLNDKVDANAVRHDRKIDKVGDRVSKFTERVAKVEGHIEAVSVYAGD